jgi:hypothetical protein
VSDQHLGEGPDARNIARFGAGGLMTSKATAIAAFAFAVFSMMGQGSWSIALTALFWGVNYEAGAVPNVMVVWGVGCLVMAGLGAWLAHRTLRLVDQTWEGHLARAATLVAAAGAVLALITILGGLVH